MMFAGMCLIGCSSEKKPSREDSTGGSSGHATNSPNTPGAGKSAKPARPLVPPPTGPLVKDPVIPPTDNPTAEIADLTVMAKGLVMKRSPRAVALYINLADAYRRQYEKDSASNARSLLQAQLVASMAVRYDPENPQARMALASALETAGERDQAVEQAQAALRLDAESKPAREMLHRLRAQSAGALDFTSSPPL